MCVWFDYIQYYELGTVLESRSPHGCPPDLTSEEFCEHQQADRSSVGPAPRDCVGPRNTQSCFSWRHSKTKASLGPQISLLILAWGFPSSFFFFLIFIHLFIWLHRVFVAACGIFVVACRIFSCGMWDLVPWPGIKPGPPALGGRSLNCWTTREVPGFPSRFNRRTC